jgi:hypothetical protein
VSTFSSLDGTLSFEFLLVTAGIFLISCFFPDILLQEIDDKKEVVHCLLLNNFWCFAEENTKK